MANLSDTYTLLERKVPAGQKFIFASYGKKTIFKVVQYTYVRQFEDKALYNLGFGDYDPAHYAIVDDARSNNGDVYKIFRTVLSTIPVFFEHFPDAVITLQGSNHKESQAAKCQNICIKRCINVCRTLNQRISVYRNYLEKHFHLLGQTYWFLGGFVKGDTICKIELYQPGRLYEAILFFKK